MVVGVGTDLVDLDRFRLAAERTPGILTRYFTEGERAYAERRQDPTERYAARFAAKEAVMKALGVGLGACELAEIEVVRDEDSGAPDLRPARQGRRSGRRPGRHRLEAEPDPHRHQRPRHRHRPLTRNRAPGRLGWSRLAGWGWWCGTRRWRTSTR